MSSVPLPQRVLVTHAAPAAFAPATLSILSKLGYAIVDPDVFARLADEDERPDLYIVDERNLGEVPDDGGPPIPIVVLTGRYGVTGADVRIAGAIPRPAGLHELYRVVQQVLEDTPRTTPRVPTHIPARCLRQGKEWQSALVSLSENGGLMRSPEPLLLGSFVRLSFELPRSGPLEVYAEAAYQLVPDVGVIFTGAPPSIRQANFRSAIEGRPRRPPACSAKGSAMLAVSRSREASGSPDSAART